MFTKITRLNVTFFRSSYVPEQRDENGNIVNGTGSTKQIEVVKFKRKNFLIPENVKEVLSKTEFDHLSNELKAAHEAEERQRTEKLFSDTLDQLRGLIANSDFLSVSVKEFDDYNTLTAALKKKMNKMIKVQLSKESEEAKEGC